MKRVNNIIIFLRYGATVATRKYNNKIYFFLKAYYD